MLDFTSANYLGIDHSSQVVRPWRQFTTGRPAALDEPKAYQQLAQRLATLQGLEAGAIAKSTLHLFWDLFSTLAQDNFIAFVDAHAYPIAQWGIESFAYRGNDVVKFKHHQIGHLHKTLKQHISAGQRPLIVTDGWCTQCGKFAPLQHYLNIARAYNGILIIDDTQALGIWGNAPNPELPYGRGGGGSLQRLHIQGPDIIVVSSLAKGFGVPIAVVSGSDRTLHHLKAASKTRVHCSSPSTADIYAAEHALFINQSEGEQRRKKLYHLIKYFQVKLLSAGIKTKGGPFPLQTLISARHRKLHAPYYLGSHDNNLHDVNLHRALHQAGIKTIPTQATAAPARYDCMATQQGPDVIFSFKAKMTFQSINATASIVKKLISSCSSPTAFRQDCQLSCQLIDEH